VADSGLAQINNPNLIRLCELTVQAANHTEFNTIKLLNVVATVPPPSTNLEITISPNQKKTVGYIKVKPGDTSRLEIVCDFSAIGDSNYPDLNIVGANGEIYCFLGPYFKNLVRERFQIYHQRVWVRIADIVAKLNRLFFMIRSQGNGRLLLITYCTICFKLMRRLGKWRLNAQNLVLI